MRTAIAQVRAALGRKHPLILGGNEIWTQKLLPSINPAQPREIVGHVAQAGKLEADMALAAARRSFEFWGRATVEERARFLERTAEIMKEQRFELAALEIFETGKPWIESDADVAEAIDFCRYYAREMRRLDRAQYPGPGEMNVQHYVPRGVAVIIAPWNFPWPSFAA
jgi:RHH-type transcriptional regulator, proline utilization regulon repressor / proline dehydrogenase / delta 1-pyrroline-5-carboxylate dehydrogenase